MEPKLFFSVATISLLSISGCDSDTDPIADSTPTNQTSSPAPDVISADREILSDPSGDDTSAIAGLWNANTDEEERFVEISNDGLYTDFAFNSEEGNCYFVTPMTLDLELEATDSTPATFSTSDGRSFTAGVIDSQLAVSQIADESILGVEVDTTTQFWTAAEGIMTIDLPECPPEVAIPLFRFPSKS